MLSVWLCEVKINTDLVIAFFYDFIKIIYSERHTKNTSDIVQEF